MKLRDVAIALYIAAATAALTGLYHPALLNDPELVFGLPRGLAWVTVWALATPVALFAYARAGGEL